MNNHLEVICVPPLLKGGGVFSNILFLSEEREEMHNQSIHSISDKV